ncbi:hypothetical protein [Nocardioides hwasunensis]|uniref:hypothetical protein n=1 Tax=Nocardioides hwasunensis TaxID=397258 RepID=UPI00296477E8|nr:hypothetical protein [Nocardioides hwasunensis]
MTNARAEDEHDEGRGRRGEGRGERRGPRGQGRGERGEVRGRRGGWQVADLPPAADAADWFRGRLPEAWFSEIEVRSDREEVTVMGTLAEEADGAEAEGRIGRFRSETKAERIEIALEAEARYQRKVSWGVRLGETEALFTHVSAPVMTRLRQPERQVLDTLVDAGVARSRSDALAWSVKLVGEHADEWLGQLRDAMAEVDKLRGEGPTL